MTDQSGGYESSSFVAEFYDYVVPYRDRKDVEFYRAAARESGGPVLELGCGTGRILLPIAQTGIEIMGIDLSSRMLRVCRERLAEQPEASAYATILEADMRTFTVPGRFKLAIIPFRAFQHLMTVEEQRACLRAVHQHLEEHGVLILDLFNPSVHTLAADNIGQILSEEPPFIMPDGSHVIRKHRFTYKDLAQQISDVELIYDVTYPDGRQEQLIHSFSMRYLFRYEAEHLLALCGFQVEQIYSDYQYTAFGVQYPGELLIIARKI